MRTARTAPIAGIGDNIADNAAPIPVFVPIDPHNQKQGNPNGKQGDKNGDQKVQMRLFMMDKLHAGEADNVRPKALDNDQQHDKVGKLQERGDRPDKQHNEEGYTADTRQESDRMLE